MAEKGSARERLRALVEEDPTIAAAEAARVLNVSRQRVHQLAGEEGIEFEQQPPRVVRTSVVEGTAAVLQVAADLVARGFVVFAPIAGQSPKCDLIAVDPSGAPLHRIEVRTAKRREGELAFDEPALETFDKLALVVPGEQVIYKPAFRPRRT